MPASPLPPPHSAGMFDPSQRTERNRLLPDLNRLLLTHSDLRVAFPRICRRLQRVLAHQHAAISLFEPRSAQFQLYAQHSPSGGALPTDLPVQLDGTPCGEVYRLRQPIVVEDLRSPHFACETTQTLLKHGRRSGCWAPLLTADGVMGALSISSGRPGAYRPDDAILLNEVAGQVSLALAMQLGLGQLAALQRELDDQIHDWSRSFRDIAATAACGIVQWGAGGAVSDANDIFLAMVGRTRRDIRASLNCADLTPQGENSGQQLHAEQELRGHGSFEPFRQEYERPDGTRIAVLVSPGLLNQMRPPWLAMIVDLGSPGDGSLKASAKGSGKGSAIGTTAYPGLGQADDLRLPSLVTLVAPHTLREVEREHIVRVLHDTKGVVGGEHGAAAILGIKRTTLQYKIKKLEIGPHS